MRSIKRSAAQCLVRRNLARQISKRLIQMIAIREYQIALANESRPKPVEIPELLPIRPPDWIFTSYPIRDDRTVIV